MEYALFHRQEAANFLLAFVCLRLIGVCCVALGALSIVMGRRAIGYLSACLLLVIFMAATLAIRYSAASLACANAPDDVEAFYGVTTSRTYFDNGTVAETTIDNTVCYEIKRGQIWPTGAAGCPEAPLERHQMRARPEDIRYAPPYKPRSVVFPQRCCARSSEYYVAPTPFVIRGPDGSISVAVFVCALMLSVGVVQSMNAQAVAHPQFHGPLPNNDTTCAICREDMDHTDVGALLRGLPCQHVFHRACIDKALYFRQHCPICNRLADTDDAIFVPIRAHLMLIVLEAVRFTMVSLTIDIGFPSLNGHLADVLIQRFVAYILPDEWSLQRRNVCVAALMASYYALYILPNIHCYAARPLLCFFVARFGFYALYAFVDPVAIAGLPRPNYLDVFKLSKWTIRKTWMLSVFAATVALGLLLRPGFNYAAGRGFTLLAAFEVV